MSLSPTPDTQTHDEVFHHLLQDIVAGRYGEGRLPSERVLSAELGASRATLREAMRKLAAWNLIEARRGSGVVVLPCREWSIEVLPAFLRYGRIIPGAPSLVEMVRPTLEMRRTMLVSMTHLLAGRLNNTDQERVTAALHIAWDKRDQGMDFVRADLKMTRTLWEAGKIMPAVWLLNRFSGIYIELAEPFSALIQTPTHYLETYTAYLNELARGDGPSATTRLRDYLTLHDESLLALLEDTP